MRSARWLGGAVAALALLAATVWTCAEGAGRTRDGAATTEGSPASADGGDGAAVPASAAPAAGESPRRNVRRRAQPGPAVPPDGETAAAGDEALPTGLVGRVVAEGVEDVVPLAGARVRLHVGVDPALEAADRHGAWLTEVAEPDSETTTGSDGRFEFALPVGSAWRVVVRARDRSTCTESGEGATDLGDVLLAERQTVALGVEDEEGRALATAEARVLLDGVRPVEVVPADAEGRVVLDASCSALVTAPGHRFVLVEDPREGQTVRLEPAAPIAGRVVDDTGAPLAAVAVLLSDAVELVSMTAADGRFRFDRAGVRCDAEGVTLGVHVPPDRREYVQAIPGDEDVRIVVRRPCIVEGTVVFQDGRPAVGASVANDSTDTEGRFRMSLETPEGDSVELWAVALTRPEGSSVSVPTHKGLVEVAVRPGETVSGVRIVLAAGPVSYFRLDVRDGEDRPALAGAWTSAPWFQAGSQDGKAPYALGVPPGTARRVTVSDARGAHGTTEIDLVTSADPEVEPVVVRLPGPRTYTLRALDTSGNPLSASQAKVRAVPAPHVVVSPDGRVAAPPGMWVEVQIESRGLRWKRHVQVPAPPQDTIDVVVPATGSVRGRFVRPDGAPAGGVLAGVQSSTQGIWTGSGGETAADGVFVVSPVPAGRGTLTGFREGGEHAVAERDVVVPEGGDLDLGDVAVAEEVLLEGRVLGEDGAGVGGTAVVVSWNGGSGSASVASDPGGRFSLRILATRDAVARATRRDGLACVEGLDLTVARTATLRLRRCGTIEVRVPRAWDEAGWEARLEPPSGAFSWEPADEHGDATATLADVPAGRWVVVVRLDGVTHRHEVTVPAGGAAVAAMGP